MSQGVCVGVDAGGTRSTALVVSAAGNVLARADGGPANYQSVGEDAARASLASLVDAALELAGVTRTDVVSAAYGVAGADRPKDFEIVRALLPDCAPHDRRALVNDSALALYAGTDDGVGIALVSGTGVNAIGRDASGRIENVGGYASELGDFGSAGDLGREAMRLAMRGKDGRGQPTALYDAICGALGLERLEDVIDLWIAKDARARAGRLAPLVFEVASAGDSVAKELLAHAGRELALSARVLHERLFAGAANVPVVLGGSVLQKGADATLVRTIARELAGRCSTHRLVADPVVGAAILASSAEGARALRGAWVSRSEAVG